MSHPVDHTQYAYPITHTPPTQEATTPSRVAAPETGHVGKQEWWTLLAVPLPEKTDPCGPWLSTGDVLLYECRKLHEYLELIGFPGEPFRPNLSLPITCRLPNEWLRSRVPNLPDVFHNEDLIDNAALRAAHRIRLHIMSRK